MRNLIQLLGILLFSVVAFAQAPTPVAKPTPNPMVTPKPNLAVIARLRKDLKGRYSLKCTLSPCVIRGDFDGDRIVDKAALVAHLSTGKKGIVIVHGNGVSLPIGPGNPIGEGGEDYSWLKGWKSNRTRKVPQPNSQVQPPVLKGESLLLEREGAPSVMIYWNGEKYDWYTLGQ